MAGTELLCRKTYSLSFRNELPWFNFTQPALPILLKNAHNCYVNSECFTRKHVSPFPCRRDLLNPLG
jgi:hypothetical protein